MISVMGRDEGMPDGRAVAVLNMVAGEGFTDEMAFEAGKGRVRRCLEEKRHWQKEEQD